MKEVILEAESRDVSKKSNLKALRKNGKIPAAFYGHNEKPEILAVDAKMFDKMLHAGVGGNVIINLKWGGNSKSVLIKEIQHDIITRVPIHIDFQAISLKEKVEVHVPLKITGEAPGVKLGGGILEHIVRDVKVKCLPTDIPEYITVDVSKLNINQSITIADLPKPEGVEIHMDPHSIVINIVAPTELEEAAPAAEAAAAGAGAAEPEVISKGKKEKEGEAAEGAASPKAESKGGEAKK